MTYTRIGFGNKLIGTPGVVALAEERGAWWLLEAVASYQGRGKLRSDAMLKDFQIWELTRKDGGAVLTCKADTSIPPVVRQAIEYTDFFRDDDEDTFKLYVELGDGQLVLMLPEER